MGAVEVVLVALVSTVEDEASPLLSVVEDDASDTVVDEEACSDTVVEEAAVDDSAAEDEATTVDDSVTVDEEIAWLEWGTQRLASTPTRARAAQAARTLRRAMAPRDFDEVGEILQMRLE